MVVISFAVVTERDAMAEGVRGRSVLSILVPVLCVDTVENIESANSICLTL